MYRLKQKLIAAGSLALALMLSLMGNAQADPDTSSAGGALFKTNCAICHGDNGAGSPLGARLHTPDLRSGEIHKKAAADLAHTISAGKNNMPAFSSKLSGDEIQKLVEYVLHLHG